MKKRDFQIDTFEKAMHFIESMRFHGAEDRLSAIFEYYPELRFETHQYLSELLGMSRESVTRTLLNFKKGNE